jgi:general secretion pathway protein L
MSKSPPSRLLVLLPPARHGGRDTPDSGLRVRTLAIAGTRVDAGEASLAELPRGVRLELVFDAADVHLATLEAPRLSDARLRLALPSLLEDRLLGDPADSHLAYASEREADGRLRVAAVDRGWLTRVLDACAAANLTPRSAWSALHLLPVPADGTLGLRVSAGHGLLRTGTTDGLSFDLAGDAALLGLALAQAQARCVRVYGDPLAAAALPWPEAVQVQDAHADLDLAHGGEPINLLQGGFAGDGWLARASGGRLPRLSLRALRAPLAWAGVAALVAIAGLNLNWLKLGAEAKALRSEQAAAFRSAFPRETTLVDPLAQTRRQLAELRARAGQPSPDDFSVLNARAAQLLLAAPVGSLTGLQYRDGSLKLSFRPNALDPGLQNTLRANAVQQGLDLRFEPDGSARLRVAAN